MHTGIQQVRDLKVKCNNNNCTWIGELRNLEAHNNICDYSLLPCRKGCTTLIKKRDIEDHVTNHCPRRPHKCHYCQEWGEYQERTTVHLDVCHQVKIKCPNLQCLETIPRGGVRAHQSVCLYEHVPCSFAQPVRCRARPLRKDLMEHTNSHLVCEIQKLKNKCKHVDKLRKLVNIAPYIFTININNINPTSLAIPSPPFYTSVDGYCMYIRVFPNGKSKNEPGTHISIRAYLMRGANDETLVWPFTGTIVIELLNQLGDYNHYVQKKTFAPEEDASQKVGDREKAQKGKQFPTYISHEKLKFDSSKNCQFLKNETLRFRVYTE